MKWKTVNLRLFLACRSHWIGDGSCDDSCNKFIHDYDLRDCCLDQIIDSSCQECICHEDGIRHPSSGRYQIAYHEMINHQIF